MRTDEHIVTRHQSPDRVPGEDAAERLLCLVTSRRRARAIVGDLAEQAEGSTAWFWQCTLRIAAACARQNLFSVSTRETAMSNDSFSLITTIWRHKWLLATCVLVSVISTRIALAFYPATYRSETSILVVPQRVPESYVRATVTARIEDRLNTITQQILSRTRLERIINEYNLYADRLKNTEMEDVVQAMRNDIRTHVLRGDAFRISYDGNNPRTVQKVTERLASLFIEENLNDRATLADSTIQFLEAQVEETRRGLTEKETSVASKRRAGHSLSTAERIEYDVLQQQFKGLLTKMQEASIAANLERRQIGEQFKLLDTARIPEEPITPNRRAATASGAAVGLGLGVILIGVTTRRRRAPTTIETRLGVET